MFVWRHQNLTQWRTFILSAFGVIIMEFKAEAIPVTGVAVLLRHSSSLCLRCCVLWFWNQICILDGGLLTSVASHLLGFCLGHCLGLSSTSCYFTGISLGDSGFFLDSEKEYHLGSTETADQSEQHWEHRTLRPWQGHTCLAIFPVCPFVHHLRLWRCQRKLEEGDREAQVQMLLGTLKRLHMQLGF